MPRYALFVLAAASFQAGCYNYLPRPEHLEPAMYLAVTLTDSGSDAMANLVGPNIKVVRGRFLHVNDQELALSVAAVETRRGAILEWRGETVVFPGEFVRSVEERQPAKAKTALLAGVSVAGFFVAFSAFGPASGGGSASGSGGNPIFH